MGNLEESVSEFKELFDPNNLGATPPLFKKSSHKLFNAEVAVIDNDLVFHFYLPDNLDGKNAKVQKFWDKFFGEALSGVALDYFHATYPRLRAMHVQEFEIDSWWMRAQGFVPFIQDIDGYVQKFYNMLDASLTN